MKLTPEQLAIFRQRAMAVEAALLKHIAIVEAERDAARRECMAARNRPMMDWDDRGGLDCQCSLCKEYYAARAANPMEDA